MGFARQSLLGKARSRPDLLKQVLNKVRTDGLLPTYRSVMQKLDNFTPLGYSSAGQVVEVGDRVEDVRVGDMVSCAGANYANHAEIVYIPKNLVVKLPENVSARHGSLATLGAIALQGIRRAELTPGEIVGVIGLGLVGQLTTRLLHAYGHPVIGFDLDQAKVDMALRHGVEEARVMSDGDPEAHAKSFSNGYGLDAVIIAAATPSSSPIELAGQMLRIGGRVSAVGDVGLDVPRRIFYEKELDLRISRSYGPGRYDPKYEEGGQDYPYSYVRWTEQRNMLEFVRLIGSGGLDVDDILTHSFLFSDAKEAYDLVMNNPNKEAYLGVLLEYEKEDLPLKRNVSLPTPAKVTPKTDLVQVGFIGSGGFAQGTLMPLLSKLEGVQIRAIASATGRTATTLGQRYGCSYACTDYRELLSDNEINLIVIATRHGLHAKMVVESLEAGKNVFVEKPLALSFDELARVKVATEIHPGQLTVGFNRRFAPLIIQAKNHFAGSSTPLMFQCRVSAGFIPANHWVHDSIEGGGRILGEVCHFVDLAQYMVGSNPVRVYATRLPVQGEHVMGDDNVMVSLDFADGSRGSILYSALGADNMPKEFVEIMGDGKSATLDNFKTLSLYSGNSKSNHKERQDKGHEGELSEVAQSILRGGESPIPLDEQFLSSLATLCVVESLKSGEPVAIDMAELQQRHADVESDEGAQATLLKSSPEDEA